VKTLTLPARLPAALGRRRPTADPLDGHRQVDRNWFPQSGRTNRPGEYPADAPPVFFGHYWLLTPEPELLAPNVACLDYSVPRGGFLCAYRWDGERVLDPSHFVTAPSRSAK
jgi:hypothetical protein